MIRLGLLALLLHLILATPPPCHADFDFPDFSTIDGLTLLGNAMQVGNELHLTPLTANQVSAVWHDEPQNVADAFEILVELEVSNLGAGGADGCTLLFQNESLAAIGQGGGAMGYASGLAGCAGVGGMPGISSSVAIEFDTWSNSCFGDGTGPDGPFNQISVHSLGDMPNSAEETASLGFTEVFPSLTDLAIHTIKVTYTPGTLEIFVDDLDTPVLSVSALLPDFVGASQCWVGFTAATGGAWHNPEIRSWSFTSMGVGNEFVRGDANGDGTLTGLVDGVFILNFQFVPGSAVPPCMDAADVDDNGAFSGLVDGLLVLNYQFVPGTPPPPDPGPTACGPDPTDDPLDCLDPPCP